MIVSDPRAFQSTLKNQIFDHHRQLSTYLMVEYHESVTLFRQI